MIPPTGPTARAAADAGAPIGRLDVETLAERLRTAWLGRAHIHLDGCVSTNDRAAAEARAGAPEGLLVTADAQTGGRGRQGRAWHSPAGDNLYFSLLLRPRRPVAEIPPLTLLAGGALAEAIGSFGVAARVKWPNDLLVRIGGRPRKLAGILTEASTEGERIGHVVVGVGLNVNTETFPHELTDRATSLRLCGGAGGAPWSRVEVLARVLASLEAAYDRFAVAGPAAAIALWEAHADRALRCRARVGGRDIEGTTAGVGADGSLRLRDDAGVVHPVVSGEVVEVLRDGDGDGGGGGGG